MIGRGSLQRIERLDYQLRFCVLGGQGENVDDDAPARFNVRSFGHANIRYAHHYILFNLIPSV